MTSQNAAVLAEQLLIMSAISASLKVVWSLNPTNLYFEQLGCMQMLLNIDSIRLRTKSRCASNTLSG